MRDVNPTSAVLRSISMLPPSGAVCHVVPVLSMSDRSFAAPCAVESSWQKLRMAVTRSTSVMVRHVGPLPTFESMKLGHDFVSLSCEPLHDFLCNRRR